MATFAKNRSKFQHIFATPHKRQFCYESLAVADGGQLRSDGGCAIAASTKFLAYPDKSGGGSSVAVLPLTSYGRRHVPVESKTYQQPLYKMHTSKVHCVSFSPHESGGGSATLASGSASGTVHIHNIPDSGLIEDYTGSSPAPQGTLSIHTESAVHGLAWHHSAENILAAFHPKHFEVLDVSVGNKCGVVPITCKTFTLVHGRGVVQPQLRLAKTKWCAYLMRALVLSVEARWAMEAGDRR